MQGLYYDAQGNPTEELTKVQEIIAKADAIEKEEQALNQLIPPCDVKSGSELPDVEYKCPAGSGILRQVSWDHRGTGKRQSRCGCVNDARAELSADRLPKDITLTKFSICEDDATLCNIPKSQHGV